MTNKYEKGLAYMAKVNGGDLESVKKRLEEVDPDFAKYIAEFAYGEIHARPGLPIREKEIATISALAAMGYPKRELMIHIHNVMNAGLVEEEVVNLLLHLLPYLGFPAIGSALKTANTVFKQRSSGQISAPPDAN